MAYQRHPHRNIVLTGFHGAGKTVVGRELSRRMRRPFIDVDVEARRRSRAPLRVLLPFGGPPQVEDSERRLIGDLSYRRESVVALSADGANLRDYLAELEDFSMVAFLDPPFEQLWERMSVSPAYAQLIEEHGRTGLHGMWADLRSRLLHCDVRIAGTEQNILRTAQVVIHCFYT